MVKFKSRDRGSNLQAEPRQPGIVVWAAPEDQKAWDRPGSLLFAVKLLHHPGASRIGSDAWRGADTVVPVVVPSFDLRYPHENSWRVQKTIHTRLLRP